MEVDGSIDDVRLAVIMLMTDEPECRVQGVSLYYFSSFICLN